MPTTRSRARTIGPLGADGYNRGGVTKAVVPVGLRHGRARLRDVTGAPLGTLEITGGSVNLTRFPAIHGPDGPLYLAYHSARREHWGHVYGHDLVAPPATSSRYAAGNGRQPPAPHDTMEWADGRRRSYYLRPAPIPCGLLYKNSTGDIARCAPGPSLRNYGAYEGPVGNRAYATERPDEDRHHQPMVWSTPRRADRARVASGGISKAFLSDGDIFYRADVAAVTIEACSSASPCPTDGGERPPTSTGLHGRVTFFYGYVWTKQSGRQYGWTVAWWQLGPRTSRRIDHLERILPD